MDKIPKNNFIDYSEQAPNNARRFSHNAMATVFEIIIINDDAIYAEQCAFQAFNELDRLEQELSRFIPNSDISRINNSGTSNPVCVGLDAFECLEQCVQLSTSTHNAFDITVGPLLKSWLNSDKTNRTPSQKELTVARARTGMHLIQLDKNQHTVSLNSGNMCIDLGGFGKGYAVDCMAKILDDWDINSALIHGGTSSVFTLDAPPGEKGWQITIRNPNDPDKIISHLYLCNRAINGSGIRKGQHIIDPRTAYPVTDKSAVWVLSETAAAGDALSTAFMIMSPEEINDYCLRHNDIQSIIITDGSENKENIVRYGDITNLE